MSYILDALKKIELEKEKKRPDGKVSISGSLYQERKQPAKKAGVWKAVLLIGVVSIVVCAATWLMLHESGLKSPAVVPPPASAPVSVIPVGAKVISLPVQPQSPPVAVPVEVTQNIAVDTDDDSSTRAVRRSKKQLKAQVSSPVQTAQTVSVPADIKLSGIAWQDERAGRRAVINGFLLKEGSVVSGAKITEIKADKVRFTSPAGMFEIKLDSVLPLEGRR